MVCGQATCKKQASDERQARWLATHPTGRRDAARAHRERNGNTPWPAKRALGLEITSLKETTPCADCGNTFPAVCMDFDHLPGFTKRYAVGTMVAHGHSRDSVMAEIAKCELVCANCHRVRTSKRHEEK